jgi:hypothetical protein
MGDRYRARAQINRLAATAEGVATARAVGVAGVVGSSTDTYEDGACMSTHLPDEHGKISGPVWSSGQTPSWVPTPS